MEATAADPRAALIANLPGLSDSDQRFARSLLSSRIPSAKQTHWIGVLADRATAAANPAPTETVTNIAGIVSLIQQGGTKLKRPAVLFQAEGQTLRLSVAGDRSRTPGSINVTCASKGFDSRTYYGRIALDGEWVPTRQDTGIASTAILASLRAFAEAPAKVAAEFGRTTGACCFCAIELTDPVSIEVGYGPICARNYGLPHRATGLRPANATKKAA